MGKTNQILVCFVILAIYVHHGFCSDYSKYSMLMPNVSPTRPESYLCTPVKINASESYYIIGFEPRASMNVAHHMLLYGCTTPGTAEKLWDCGEMSRSTDDQYESSSPCRTGSEIIYAWAKDAPPLDLPEDVGFKVGKNSSTKYLVLQVHYAHVEHFKHGKTDASGVVLHYTKQRQQKLAGVFLLGTAGSVPPMSTEYMETACIMTEDKVMHPFAYRVHTHSLGKVVSGYVIKRGSKWIELGKQDPDKPQMFYSVHSNVKIEKNDILAARCTMVSSRHRVTHVGPTNDDEMCNFYLMYWVKNQEPLHKKYCFTAGPPAFYWQDANLQNIPDHDASTL